MTSKPIEDYGFLSNAISCALVGRDGSIDWLCLPRFDSDACFAALLGGPEHGRWLLAPAAEPKATRRNYRDGTLVLETVFETETGVAKLIDFMPLTADERFVELVRIVEGVSGRVEMRMDLSIRFGCGRIVPWVLRRDWGLSAMAGPDALTLATPVDLRGEAMHTRAAFTVEAGDRVPFTLAYRPSHLPEAAPSDWQRALEATEAWWRAWSGRCVVVDRDDKPTWVDACRRSLTVLKGLTFQPTGGIAAAATTSLPEKLGGERNWDYRFCWLRDATLTLYALVQSGYREEADQWRGWLLRACAGRPDQLQVMYGVAGERRLTELEVPWLPGYEHSRPVRIGNAAHEQLQLDVYGEVIDALHVARRLGLEAYDESWRLQRVLLDQVSKIWRQPDRGMWEVRGEPRHFTHSKLMCWVALDRGVQAVEAFGLEGPVARWRAARDEIHADICRNGFDERRKTFVRFYGGRSLDAALLVLPQTGFLPEGDPRIAGTVDAIATRLASDGLILRYDTEHPEADDGLPAGEGAFVVASFWLADAYALLGRRARAEELFERLLGLRNDLGLLAEEYDPRAKRQLGNFPQAFSHIGLVNTAHNLGVGRGPAAHRAESETKPG